jgi:CO dehydrogenase maturation factor
VDVMFVVVEPGTRSIQTAKNIAKLAQGLGIQRLLVIGNKVRHERDAAFIRDHLGELPVVGMLPYTEKAIDADMHNHALYDVAPEMVEKVRDIVALI